MANIIAKRWRMRRAVGIKVAKLTCLPPGENYWITATPSQRFGRIMPLVYTNAKTLACENEGIFFDGIRVHGGNTAADTDACVLVAKYRDNPDRVHNSVADALTALIIAEVKKNGPIPLAIRNRPRAI